jgi:predicted O-methyltransferase YrrM
MSKVFRAFKALLSIIRKPWLLNLVLDEDGAWDAKIRAMKGNAYRLSSIDFRSLLKPEGSNVYPFAFLDGGSLPTDLALLKSLAAGIPDCRYFEIGTWRGESVANVANVAKQCTTLNLSPEQITDLGLPKAYADLHGFFSKDLPNVSQLYGDTATFDFKGLNQHYDLVFIDGDHHYNMVKSDTENVFNYLLHEKSIVVWHDAAYTPEKLRPEVIYGILQGTPAALHHKIFHVSNTQCAVFLPEGFSETFILNPPETPNFAFEISLNIKPVS